MDPIIEPVAGPVAPDGGSQTPAGTSVKHARNRRGRRLHPLAPLTFLLRNLGKTIPLTGVIILSVMLVSGIIALIDSIPYSIRTIYMYTKESLGVSPRGDNSHTPELVTMVQRESPVPIERTVICRVSASQVQSIVGKWPFIMLGLSTPDMEYFLKRQGMTGITGRLPRVGAAEAVVTDPVARNLNLHIGSIVQGPGPDFADSYSQKNVIVVGIAHTPRWLMLNSIEYQRLYHFPPVDLAMIFAKNRDDQTKLDAWAQKRFVGQRAQVYTYAKIEADTRKMFNTLFTILNVVIGMLVVVITFMMGMLINIYQAQRLVEFGLLQAIGYTKKRLIARAMLENVLVVALGWGLGVIAAFGLLIGLRKVLMEPHAFALDVWDAQAYRYTIPIPITIIVVACGTVALRFRKFDPVAVVERRLV